LKGFLNKRIDINSLSLNYKSNVVDCDKNKSLDKNNTKKIKGIPFGHNYN